MPPAALCLRSRNKFVRSRSHSTEYRTLTPTDFRSPQPLKTPVKKAPDSAPHSGR
jgi:hypothetical protein